MSIYLDNGFLDIEELDRRDAPFNFLIGGRGVGKTYGLLSYYLDKKEKICFMRRTDKQAAMAASLKLSPYKKICEDRDISMEEDGDFHISRDIAKTVSIGNTDVAIVLALSTVANMRGFDASDCTAIVYDEFIPEKHEKPIKEEAEAIFNAYETINRNRELLGEKPVKMWFLSNANRIDSPIIVELGLMNTIMKMRKTEQERIFIPERGVQIVCVTSSPISKKKETTALYRLVDTSYKDMALGNDFREDAVNIISHDLREFRPVTGIGEIYIYKHKSTPKYYITTHRSGDVRKFGTGETEVNRFTAQYGKIVDLFYLGYVDAETIEAYYTFKRILKI